MPAGHAEAFLVFVFKGTRTPPKGVKPRQTRTPPHICPGTVDLEPQFAHPGEIKQSLSPGTLKGLGDTLHANTQPSA